MEASALSGLSAGTVGSVAAVTAEPTPASGFESLLGASAPTLLTPPSGKPTTVAATPGKPPSVGVPRIDPETGLPLAPPAEGVASTVPGSTETRRAHPDTPDRAPDVPPPQATPEQFLAWLDHVKGLQTATGLRDRPAGASAATAVSTDLPPPAISLPAQPRAELATVTANEVALNAANPAQPHPPAATSNLADALASAGATTGLPAATPPTGHSPQGLPFLLGLAPAAPHSAAALNTPPPTTPVAMDAPDWPQRLGEQIHWRLGEGVQEARIEISPRDLGSVDVRLSMDDSGLKVHLSAAHAQTRELLQQELPRLKEALQQGGIALADAQVGREAPGRDARPPAWAQNPRNAPERAEAEALPEATTRWQRHRGLLDDYA